MQTITEEKTSPIAQAQQRAAERAWDKIQERQIAAFRSEEQKKAERKQSDELAKK